VNYDRDRQEPGGDLRRTRRNPQNGALANRLG
jgi:hypothetical protein